jgi:hypothetical protein
MEQLSQLKLLLLNSNKIPEVPVELWAEKFTELQTFDLKDNPLDVNVVEVITKYGILSSTLAPRGALPLTCFALFLQVLSRSSGPR